MRNKGGFTYDEEDPVRLKRRDAGLCLHCVAFRGTKKGAERCMAMTPGCPVPEDLIKVWRRSAGRLAAGVNL